MITGGTAPPEMRDGPKIFALKHQRGLAGMYTGTMALDLFVAEDLECLMFC